MISNRLLELIVWSWEWLLRMIAGFNAFEDGVFEAEMKMWMMIVNKGPITPLLYLSSGYSRQHPSAWPSSAGYARKTACAGITNYQTKKHIYLFDLVGWSATS